MQFNTQYTKSFQKHKTFKQSLLSYSTWMYGWMQFYNFNGKNNSTLIPKQYYVVQCHTQEGSITANIKMKIYFNLPEFCVKIIMIWICHMDYYANERYDIILGRYMLTYLVTFKYMVELLKGLQQQWLIWVRMNLKI